MRKSKDEKKIEINARENARKDMVFRMCSPFEKEIVEEFGQEMYDRLIELKLSTLEEARIFIFVNTRK